MTVDMPSTFETQTFDGGLILQADLLTYALMTVLIEVPLFFLCGWRKVTDCAYFACVNVMSNLLLNEFLSTIDAALYWQTVLPAEVVVVLLEFVLCTYRFTDNRRKLFKTLIFTNMTSFLVGLLL